VSADKLRRVPSRLKTGGLHGNLVRVVSSIVFATT
jgi:hypothetical protein